jgi:glycosyltransferase involved in cell wall biosynthesis
MVSSLPPHKGITPYTVNLAAALARQPELDLEIMGFHSLYPRLLYPGGNQEDPTMDDQIPPGVTCRRVISWYDPISWVRAGLSARGDIVHAQWWSYPLAPAYAAMFQVARRRNKPVVLTLHNVLPHEQSTWRNFLNSVVMSYADHIIVHSQRMRDTLVAAKRFPDEKVSVIPHGLLKPALKGPPDRAGARQELGLPREARIVLYFGHIRPYKGIRTLLHAFRIVADRVPDAYLVIAGQPWVNWGRYESSIEGLGIRDRVIIRLEYVPSDQTALYFAAADVLVLPYTHFDAQSGVGAIALALGRAMVVTDVGGLPDIVRDERVVVPPRSAGPLAEAISTVLSDKRLQAKLERDSAELAKEFEWDGIAARTVEAYRSVLEAAAAY